MKIVNLELMKLDIFEKAIRTRANELKAAMHNRRSALNAEKSKLLKSNYVFKRSPTYTGSLGAVKDSITYLTIRINKISVMEDKNIFDEELLNTIESDYRKQL